MNVLAIGAHPDDLEFLSAGTLARYAQRGDRVFMAIATDGRAGSYKMSPDETARVRRGEAEASAKIIGAELIWMGFADEFLFDTEETRLKFIDVMRQTQADVVFCHCHNDYQMDHRSSGQVAVNVRMLPSVKNVETPHPAIPIIPHVYFMDSIGGIDFQPEEYVDISETFELKKQMLSCHESQKGFLEEFFGMSALQFMEIQARFRGIQSGFAFAEGFRNLPTWPRRAPKSLLP